MDFFKEVKNRLAELEELQKQAQQMDSKAMFQPKGQGQQATERWEHNTEPAYVPQQSRQKKSSTPDGRPTRPSESQKITPVVPRTTGSIFDNLGDRLDEAYLLQEILGPPRCMRELE